MIELGLIKSLLNKEFYDQHKNLLSRNELFTKDIRKIKQALDGAMEQYGSDLTPQDLQAVFLTQNQSLTTASKVIYEDMFKKLSIIDPINSEIASDTFSKMFQQFLGEKIANIGFECVNGSLDTLEPLRRLLDNYKDDFTPNVRVEWDDHSFETLLDAADLEAQWKFNIPTLHKKVEGVTGGHLVVIGARPNTGKTSFHASLVAADGGWAQQGAKVVVLCNEEKYTRVASRYLCAASNMSMKEVRENPVLARKRYEYVKNNVRIKDSTGKDMKWVESVVKHSKPDVLILDMGDKFADQSNERTDLTLKAAAIHARNIAKQYDCVVLWMSQLSAVAEGRVDLDQSMMEGSKTGKAAEADLMLLIAKTKDVEGEGINPERHINFAKNKINGFDGRVLCMLDGDRATFRA